MENPRDDAFKKIYILGVLQRRQKDSKVLEAETASVNRLVAKLNSDTEQLTMMLGDALIKFETAYIPGRKRMAILDATTCLLKRMSEELAERIRN